QVHLVRMERITAEATDLGLVEPNPGQIVVLVARDRGNEAALEQAPREKLPVTTAPPVLAQHLELLPEEQAAALALSEPALPLMEEYVPLESETRRTPVLDAVEPDALPELFGE